MRIKAKTNRQPLTLQIKVRTYMPTKLTLRVKDADQKNTYFTNRYMTMDGEESFYVRMPQSPRNAEIIIFDKEQGDVPKSDTRNFEILQLRKLPLKTTNTSFESDNPVIKDFVKFAQEFSEKAGVLSAGNSIYTSDNGMFRIDYKDTIRDNGGKVLNTPARISKQRGIIQVSKAQFKKYTIPMRMAILLHEFAHYYLNNDMSNEIEADLNALLIYLGLGYPRIDAFNVFIGVFKNTPTHQNIERIEILERFIADFDKKNVGLVYEEER